MVNMETTVSIIMPTYNRAALLPRSISSILNQTFEDFELIIIDDGSTDDTEDVVRGFNDKRIVYIKNNNNLGATTSRNEGIKISKGRFIAFQDSDDEWMPQKLEKQINILNGSAPDLGVVYTGFNRVNGNRREYIPKINVITKEGNIHEELLKGNFIGTPTLLVKKECFDKSGLFDDRIPRLQDWDLALRLSKYFNFAFIAEPMLIAYQTESSISANEILYSKAMEIILSKYSSEFRKYKKVFAGYLFDTGIYICIQGNFKKGRAYLKKAIVQNPLNFKYSAFYILSLFSQTFFTDIIDRYRNKSAGKA